MGYAIAAAAVTAIGAGMSASGASKNAKALKKAQKKIAKNETAFANTWNANLQGLISEKENKLYNLGDIFERFESTGAFGDTDTLESLRKAQSDYSALAAGDFTGFESQLRKTLSDSLIGTVGSGSPIGTYAQLAADTQMNFRLQGIQSSVGLSEFFSNQANNLLGLEFGVMDQEFNIGYGIDRNRQTAINNSLLGQASTEGVSQAAWGQTVQAVGSSIGSVGTYLDTRQMQQQSLATQQQLLQAMQPGSSTVNPISIPATNYNYTPTNYSYPDNIRTTGAPINSNVPVPYNEAIYSTIPELPSGDGQASAALFNTPVNTTSSSSSNILGRVANAYNPFGLLSDIGRKIASAASQ